MNRYYLADERQYLNIHFGAPACSLDHFVRHRELAAAARGKAGSDAESKLTLPAGFGINLIGQFTSSTGLGIGAGIGAQPLAQGRSDRPVRRPAFLRTCP